MKQLPIYPIPEQEIVLQEVPSELERQIGKVRRTVTTTYLDAHSRVQEVVSQWIGVEQSVERTCISSFSHRAADAVLGPEPVTRDTQSRRPAPRSFTLRIKRRRPDFHGAGELRNSASRSVQLSSPATDLALLTQVA